MGLLESTNCLTNWQDDIVAYCTKNFVGKENVRMRHIKTYTTWPFLFVQRAISIITLLFVCMANVKPKL